jgi:hypothetical protein
MAASVKLPLPVSYSHTHAGGGQQVLGSLRRNTNAECASILCSAAAHLEYRPTAARCLGGLQQLLLPCGLCLLAGWCPLHSVL